MRLALALVLVLLAGRRDWSSVAAVVAAVKGMRARAIAVVIWWVGVLVSGFVGLFVCVGWKSWDGRAIEVAGVD